MMQWGLLQPRANAVLIRGISCENSVTYCSWKLQGCKFLSKFLPSFENFDVFFVQEVLPPKYGSSKVPMTHNMNGWHVIIGCSYHSRRLLAVAMRNNLKSYIVKTIANQFCVFVAVLVKPSVVCFFASIHLFCCSPFVFFVACAKVADQFQAMRRFCRAKLASGLLIFQTIFGIHANVRLTIDGMAVVTLAHKSSQRSLRSDVVRMLFGRLEVDPENIWYNNRE